MKSKSSKTTPSKKTKNLMAPYTISQKLKIKKWKPFASIINSGHSSGHCE